MRSAFGRQLKRHPEIVYRHSAETRQCRLRQALASHHKRGSTKEALASQAQVFVLADVAANALQGRAANLLDRLRSRRTHPAMSPSGGYYEDQGTHPMSRWISRRATWRAPRTMLMRAVDASLTSKELAEVCMQIFHVFGVTAWATTGYKDVDSVASLEKESGSKKAIATR